MSIIVNMPNEKLAKAFMAAKPDNIDAKDVIVKVDKESYLKEIKKPDPNPNHVKVDVTRTKTNSRRVGVMSITKAENAQLGLLLKYIFTNDEVYNSLPADVLVYPDAFTKLCGRYSV